MDRRIGIIGGSGLGQTLLAEAQGQAVTVDTPFGKPASDIILMQWQGTPVAFLARHGVGHVYNPSQVPYRANIYALKAVVSPIRFQAHRNPINSFQNTWDHPNLCSQEDRRQN